jgi:hypothetical protein
MAKKPAERAKRRPESGEVPAPQRGLHGVVEGLDARVKLIGGTRTRGSMRSWRGHGVRQAESQSDRLAGVGRIPERDCDAGERRRIIRPPGVIRLHQREMVSNYDTADASARGRSFAPRGP